MLAPEFKAQLEAKGHLVVYARVFVHDDGKEIQGLSANGEPEVKPVIDCNGKSITPTVIIPASVTGKFYFGDDAETVKAKIQAGTPDVEKVKEDEEINGTVISVVRTVGNLVQ
jgi:hypothetical protein